MQGIVEIYLTNSKNYYRFQDSFNLFISPQPLVQFLTHKSNMVNVHALNYIYMNKKQYHEQQQFKMINSEMDIDVYISVYPFHVFIGIKMNRDYWFFKDFL